MKLFCDRPDVHLPRVKCNQPLPCKIHGSMRGRVAHFEDFENIRRASPAPRWLIAPRLFDTRIGERWRAIADKFLPFLPE